MLLRPKQKHWDKGEWVGGTVELVTLVIDIIVYLEETIVDFRITDPPPNPNFSRT